MPCHCLPSRRLVPLVFAATAALHATAQIAVSPADRSRCEGSSFTHFPLGRPNARFQFLYGDLPPLFVVHGHGYRRDAAGVRGHVDGFTADLEVTLSTAQVAPAQASATFTSNSGGNATVVLPRQQVVFAGTDRPALDPSPVFDLIVPYAVPFVLPANPSTLCVDITMYGNTSAAGTDRNLSLYLDGHDWYPGRSEQTGFRTSGGCPAPGNTSPMYAQQSLWHYGTSMQLVVAARDGIADDGRGLARTFVCLGARQANLPWPGTASCALLTTTDLWFALGGTNSTTGSLDSSLGGLPVLPPGYRLWLQAGSIDLGSGALVLSDLSTLIVPPPPPAAAPCARIAASTDRGALTGAVSFSVPVTMFY